MSSSTSDASSVFKDGKLKPGTYKIQNTNWFPPRCLDIEDHSMEARCRPEEDLGEGRGIWEINPFGAGYTVQMVGPGMPERFCIPLKGIQPYDRLCVGAYPVAWRVEATDTVGDVFYFHWATSDMVWDLQGTDTSDADSGRTVNVLPKAQGTYRQMWKLIPVETPGKATVKVEGMFTAKVEGTFTAKVEGTFTVEGKGTLMAEGGGTFTVKVK